MAMVAAGPVLLTSNPAAAALSATAGQAMAVRVLSIRMPTGIQLLVVDRFMMDEASVAPRLRGARAMDSGVTANTSLVLRISRLSGSSSVFRTTLRRPT